VLEAVSRATADRVEAAVRKADDCIAQAPDIPNARSSTEHIGRKPELGRHNRT